MFHRTSACAVIVAIAAAVAGARTVAAQDPAHAVADRFAGEAERAEARRKAEARKKREAAEKAAQTRKAEPQKRGSGEDRYAFERLRKEEMEMLARARREAEEMRVLDETRQLIEAAERDRAKVEELLAKDGAAPSDAKPEPKAADAKPDKAEESRRREEAAALERAKAEEEARAGLERLHRTRRLVATFKRVREIREMRLADAAERRAVAERQATAERKAALETTAATTPPPAAPVIAVAEGGGKPAAPAQPSRVTEVQPPAPSANPAPPAAAPAYTPAAGPRETTFAVLLSMQAGTRGIRRFNKKADPVLCTVDGCFVSGGAAQAAIYMPGRKAMGFINTWGRRAGACSGKLGCVFRGIDLGELPGFLRPVDLRVVLHDRRLGQVISRDSGCRSEAGRISCSNGIYADTYAMWIVPESIAEAAGAEALERAVADGLDGPRSAELLPRR